MADSIPSLRRKLAEAQAEIAALKAATPAETVKEVVRYVDRPVDREVVRYERVETVRTEYVTDPAQEETIRDLQEALRQCQSSQLDS